MSTKSGKSSARKAARKTSLKRSDGPRSAEELAGQYRIVLEVHPKLGFVGSSVEMPTVFADGSTADRCVAATRHALSLAIATMMELGHAPPLPASLGKRDAQVNIRVAAHEKLLLQEAARRSGFTGISDFLRALGLRQVMSA
jgi:predicted RNase H-like HicB family nuclease